MKKIVSRFLFLLFFIASILKADATHMLGAEISWSCVGQDSFIVKLIIYTDCNSQSAMNSGPIKFHCAATGSSITSLAYSLPSPVDITPVCKSSCTRCQSLGCSFPFGMQRWTIQGLVRLNGAGNCCNVRISWSECCRTNTITTGSYWSDFYTEAFMNRCQNPCDNAPAFASVPAVILCSSQDFVLNQNMTDADVKSNGSKSDSFTFEWAQPMSAANTNIGYTGQYSYTRPVYFWGFPNDALPFPRGMHLDPQTGEIQFRPMKAEVTVMVVKVNEFRNGVKIAEIRREFFVLVIACTGNNPPSVTTPNNYRTKSVCTGDTAIFDFSTSDPNTNDTLLISVSNLPTGALWTHTNGQQQHPTARLSWITTDADANSQPYYFFVTAKDNACYINGTFTLAYMIYVKLRIHGKVKVSDRGCGLYHFDLDEVNTQKLNYVLNISGKKITLDQSQNYRFETPGVYPYILTVSYPNSCNIVSDTGTFTIDTFLQANLPADTAVYCGRSVVVNPEIRNTKGHVKYFWSTGDTGRVLITDPILQNTSISLTIQDSTGCSITDSMKISLKKMPSMIPADTAIYCGRLLTLNPVLNFKFGQLKYNWSTGDTEQVLNTGLVLQNQRILLTVTDSAGCTLTDSINIAIKNKPPMIPADTVICTGSSMLVYPNISYHLGRIKYKWNNGDTSAFMILPRLFNNSFVTLTTTDSAGCIDQNNMIINLKSDYKMIPSDLKVCTGRPLNITPNTGFTKGKVNYMWSNGDTNKTLTTGALFNDSLFTLTILDSAGCNVHNMLYATLLKNPEILMNPVTDICNKTKTVIFPYYQAFGLNNSIVSYAWQRAGNPKIISGAASYAVGDSGKYVVRATDLMGCSSTDTISVNVLAPIDTGMQINGPIITVAPGMKKYYWFWNNKIINSGTDNSYKSFNTGWYYVVLSDFRNCFDTTRSVYITLDGIESASRDILRFYPNPTNGKIKLLMNKPLSCDANLLVTNIFGLEIMNQTFSAQDMQNTLEIDLTDQPAGAYTVIIHCQNSVFYQLIIKE